MSIAGHETRKQFSRAEAARMFDSGIFEDQRLELIDGDLIVKTGQSPPNAHTLHRVFQGLVALFGVACVCCQSPIDVDAVDHDRNFPEPDVAVLVEAKEDYERRHPFGSELTLVIEVAETSLYRDVTIKRDLYARAGVPEYWVIDLAGRQVIVYRALSQGTYTQNLTFTENESIALEAEPGKPIAVAGLLPAA